MPEQTNLNDVFNELEKCTVGIKVNDSINGTGIIVSEEGLILTCYHLIGDRVNETPFSDNIKVILSGAEPNPERPVTFEHDKSNAELDIAFLKLLEKFDNSGVAKLDKSRNSFGHKFYAKGFRKPEISQNGLSAKGEIRGLIRSPDNVLRLQINCNEISEGMSGSAVLDIDTGLVVGMISLHYKRPDEPTLNFAIPVESIIEPFPGIKEKNPGLNPVNRFLRSIDEVESSIYKWIDEVYVPPIEYKEIKTALKRDKIVFITGTKEFGKTFTAVRLMYEFFKESNNNGKNNTYTPRWVRARKEQGRPEGSDPQELLKLIEKEDSIKPHEIVYFEDPFGKTEYQRSAALEDRIGNIIDSINSIEDAYVIITSREEVFKEFVREQLATVELVNFEKKLNLKRASYGIEERKEMLLRWARVKSCKWLLDSALKKLVLEAIENQQFLPTPLNIKDFVIASQGNLDSNKLKELMKLKSEETVRRFADEILRMDEDEKVLFLAFPYAGLGKLDVDFAKKMYDIIIIAWTQSNQKYYMDFERVIKWFEGDKINISKHSLAFSHPSYQEAFQYAIGSEKRNSIRVRDILARLLYRLAVEDEAVWIIAYAIASNYDKLPPNIQQLLFKLADNDKAAAGVAGAIASNYDKLPPNIQQLLFKLADSKNMMTVSTVAGELLIFDFDKLPSNIREQLMLKLADEAPGYVSNSLAINFNKLPSNIREQLMLKLADYDVSSDDVAGAVASNYDKLPPNIQQLLFKLADNDGSAAGVARAIEYRFDKLPSNIREQLILKLADNALSARDVVRAIASNYDKLPPNIQQLLFKLIEKGEDVWYIAEAIASNYDKLPPNIQQLLFKLADNEIRAENFKALFSMGQTLSAHFDKLPSNIREQLILKLADNDKWAGLVAGTIASNYDKLPPNIQQLLFKLIEKDDVLLSLSPVVRDYRYKNLPDHIRDELWAKLKGQ